MCYICSTYHLGNSNSRVEHLVVPIWAWVNRQGKSVSRMGVIRVSYRHINYKNEIPLDAGDTPFMSFNKQINNKLVTIEYYSYNG